jgi:hypothetical protein
MKKRLLSTFTVFTFVTSLCVAQSTTNTSDVNLKPHTPTLLARASVERINSSPQDAYKNELHEKNIGKINFSKKEIDATYPNEAEFSDQFTNSDFIYFRPYFKNGIQKYPVFDQKGKSYYNTTDVLLLKFLIDDKDSVLIRYSFQNSYVNPTSIDFSYRSWCTFNGAVFSDNYILFIPYGKDSTNLLKCFRDLSIGKHTIKLVISPALPDGFTSNSIMAEGSFTYNKLSDKVIARPRKTFRKAVEPKMTDPELEQRMVTCMNQVAKANGWKEKFTEAIIVNDDWTIWQNEVTGIITKRVIVGAVKATWPDGTCTFQYFVFSQQYNGSGYQNSLNVEEIRAQEKVECD